MDGFGFERQFIDHAAPVWRALPPAVRGRFLTDTALVSYARDRGIDAEGISAEQIRRSSAPPKAAREDGPQAFVVSIGDQKIARRLGYRRFAFMEHGAGQAYIGERGAAGRHHSYSGGMDREDTELFLVPNEYSRGLWAKAYPAARVEIVGSPRLDDLPERIDMDTGGPVLCVSFHWPAFVAPEAGTAIGHYFLALPALAAAFPGRVIGHAHPKADWPARVERYFARAGVPFVADFDDVCRQADVYVCDNSSTLFEFAATGRPVVLLNSPMYRRNVSHGLRFESSPGCPITPGLHYCAAAHVGIQVDEPADLIPAIEEALADPEPRRTAREAALRLVYPIRHDAAERAAAALSAWAGLAVAVAA